MTHSAMRIKMLHIQDTGTRFKNRERFVLTSLVACKVNINLQSVPIYAICRSVVARVVCALVSRPRINRNTGFTAKKNSYGASAPTGDVPLE